MISESSSLDGMSLCGCVREAISVTPRCSLRLALGLIGRVPKLLGVATACSLLTEAMQQEKMTLGIESETIAEGHVIVSIVAPVRVVERESR